MRRTAKHTIFNVFQNDVITASLFREMHLDREWGARRFFLMLRTDFSQKAY